MLSLTTRRVVVRTLCHSNNVTPRKILTVADVNKAAEKAENACVGSGGVPIVSYAQCEVMWDMVDELLFDYMRQVAKADEDAQKERERQGRRTFDL